jgi:prepilin-type N-terminal cleavage/methylation domain-containing protein/prepilin-type processing-associated H-X9-DG protein
MPRTRRPAFTLIELLVVIAVIAIIAALLFPVFAKVKEKARQATCLSNERQIASGTRMYMDDYDDAFPFVLNGAANWTQYAGLANEGDDGNPVIRSVTGQEPQFQLVTVVAPYVRNPSVWYCPSVGPDFVWDAMVQHGAWKKGARMRDQGTTYQYTYLAVPWPNSNRYTFLGGKKFSIVREPARWPMLWDEPWIPGDNEADPDAGGAPHTGGLNVAYGDGHAKYYRMETMGPQAGFWNEHGGDGIYPGQ